MNKQGAKQTQMAWVVFTNKTDLAWLRIFKKGFRHCFVVLNDGHRWMSVDPLSAYTDIQIYHHIDASFDLPKWLSKQSYEVVKVTPNKTHQKTAPAMFLTCVEAVKRIIGVHNRFIITPWQLYRFLQKSKDHMNLEKTDINNNYKKEKSYG